MGENKPGIQEFFNRLNKDTMHLVDEFYDENAVFQDAAVEYTGRRQIKDYYTRLYKNVYSIKFEFVDELAKGDVSVLIWRMILSCKLNNGAPITVPGVSHIRFGGREGKAVYHRDYFDLGEFVYENIPVFGSLVRFIKRKFSGQ